MCTIAMYYFKPFISAIITPRFVPGIRHKHIEYGVCLIKSKLKSESHEKYRLSINHIWIILKPGFN